MKAGTAVLVTGASTGIGRKISEALAGEGHIVYASVRNDADFRSLAAIDNVHPVHLDVTEARQVAAAVDTITAQGGGLYGLVNNAGIVTLGPIVDGDDSEFDLTMKVNVYGPYRVTRAVAPLITAAKGRIVLISSVAGILAERNVAAYSMSKHAIEAFTDCLADEMQPLGVHVSVVEPGTFRSEIGNNAAKRLRPDARSLLPDFSRFDEPVDVVRAVTLALFEPRPKRRYLVVPNEGQARATIRKQIEQLVQLNDGHRYTYDRTAIIRMIDEALDVETASRMIY